MSNIKKDNARKAAWKKANKEKQREYDRNYRKANREKSNAWARAHPRKRKVTAAKSRAILLRRYGLTHEAYKRMHDAQLSCCKICGTHAIELHYKKLTIDHNHKTNKVRGLLCTNCNLGLGNFKDDIDLLIKALVYLGRHR